MAYYPQTFPYYPPQPQPQPQTGIIWVQGESGAKGYLVAPNTTVQLWDSEAQVIYIKSADAAGLPSIKVLDYTIRDTAPKQPEPAAWASKEDLDALRKDFEALREALT